MDNKSTATPGGRKVRHTAAQRVEVTRTKGQEFKNKEYDAKEHNPLVAEYIGQRIKMKQVKSKVGGREGSVASVDFYYGLGLDIFTNLMNMAEHLGIVTGTTWKTFANPATGEVYAKHQGGKAMAKALQEDAELFYKMEDMVLASLRGIDIADLDFEVSSKLDEGVADETETN
jgi:recA bacterial DNA recombination protein.